MTDTVVTSRVLGSANPIAKKFRAIGSSFQGIGCGIIFLIIGVVLIYLSVNGVTEYSKIVASLSLKTPDQVAVNEGLVKISGKTDNVTATKYSYIKCVTKSCDATTNAVQEIPNLLNYTVEKERFEVVKKTTTETSTREENGQQVEDKTTKITYEEEWVSKGSTSGWAQFYMGGIKIKPNDNTKLMAEMVTQTVELVKTDNTIDPLNTYGQTVSDSVGTVRITVNSLPVSDINFIVVGNVSNGQITSGDPFIITDQSDAELISSLKTEESTQRTMYIVGSWVLIFLGLSMLFAPIIELIDIIPLAGGPAKFVAGIVSAILTTVIVASGWLFIKFWYVFVILFIVVIIVAVKLVIGAKKKA